MKNKYEKILIFLDSIDIKLRPHAGTLLSIFRDNVIKMPWDDDLDFFIKENEWKKNEASIILFCDENNIKLLTPWKNGTSNIKFFVGNIVIELFIVSNKFINKELRESLIKNNSELKILENKEKLDKKAISIARVKNIEIFNILDNEIKKSNNYFRVDRYASIKFTDNYNIFKKVHGITFYLPPDPAALLVERYGTNWNKPIIIRNKHKAIFKYYLKESKRKNIITFGTFDLLHNGHKNLFRRISKKGFLIVGVASDDYISFKKPVLNEEQRLKKILSMYPGFIYDPTKKEWGEIIKDYKTNIVIMGKDHKSNLKIINSINQSGGNVEFIKRTPFISSTKKKSRYKK